MTLCFRDKELIIKRYINSPSFFFSLIIFFSHLSHLSHHSQALNSLICADAPLSNYSLTHPMTLTFDLWPCKPFQQCPLTWWIFAPHLNGRRTDNIPKTQCLSPPILYCGGIKHKNRLSVYCQYIHTCTASGKSTRLWYLQSRM